MTRAEAWAKRSLGMEYEISSIRGTQAAIRRTGLTGRKVSATPAWWLLERDGVEVGAAHLGEYLTVYGIEIVARARTPRAGRRIHVALSPRVWADAQAATGMPDLTPVEWVRALARQGAGRRKYMQSRTLAK